MKTHCLPLVFLASVIVSYACSRPPEPQEPVLLRENWAIQSSAAVGESGSVISTTAFKPENWYPATVPSTVLGTLVENKVYPDPYFGTNILKIPGYITKWPPIVPDDSPFKVSWWYRTEFPLPAGNGAKNTWIRFHSINYKANIWLNGSLIADTASVQGAYRIYDLNITDYAKPGEINCLALEIFPPERFDLTIAWVDWNPTPPGRGMGIWYDVTVRSTGLVTVKNPQVITKLNLPSTDQARLTIASEVENLTDGKIKGKLKGTIDNIVFTQEVTLGPKESKKVVFDPSDFSQLVISEPRLWWPHTAGPQNLYNLNLTFETKGSVSDIKKVRFGIREISSWMNDFDGKHTRVFQINGKNIVIRGGGYVEDMLLRPSDERIDADIRYAKHMGLNTLRLEAPRGSDYLFEKCDEEGILLMVGWCCCSSWEMWDRWTPEMEVVAQKSWEDLILRLRNHPSVFDWLYGSDMHPTEKIEKMYLNVLNELDQTRPFQSSATQDPSTVTGNTGVWMGPYPDVYSYMPPSYWYGKLEFNTEAGPSGEQIPPVESMRKMMPEQDLWPISDSWNIRLNKAFFPAARKALFSRYGKPENLNEYSMKSQVLQYEASRAMFEAYAGNKYKSSGIIYWMYNSAWPTMYWQLYDYFLAPNGAFYGTRKACENLHIQYSYDDHSVRVVNGLYRDFSGLKASAKLYDMKMNEIHSEEVPVAIKADESVKVMFLEKPRSGSGITFLKLILNDDSGSELSSNFYWLSSKGDENADFTALNRLPEVELSCYVSPVHKENGRYRAVIEIENPSDFLAFSVNPKIIRRESGDLVLPVFWEDNYFALLPKEKRSVMVEFSDKDLGGEIPVLAIDGWNIRKTEQELK